MKKIISLSFIGLSFLGCKEENTIKENDSLVNEPPQNTSTRPNIVFILADDWGWTDWQMNGDVYGSDFYETPNLNKLASEGIYFSQAYAHPLSSPSRAAFLTGKYPGARLHLHQAITGDSDPNPSIPQTANSNKKTCFPTSLDRLPLEEITIAEELKRGGYKTYQMGKWHLGNKKYYPTKQGFDQQFAVSGAGPGAGGYFAPYEGIDDIIELSSGEYLTERLTDEACKIIKTKHSSPYFLYLAHYNVHSPYEAKENLINKYKEKLVTNPSTRHKHPIMSAMIQSLDESVGKIINTIEENDLRDNTIVIVMGDNGGVDWTNDNNNPNIPVTSNYPLRGGKCNFSEGGVRVPLLIWGNKELITENKVINTPVHIIDMYPTLLELASMSPSKDKDVIDGVSILPLIKGGTIKERPLFCHFPRASQIGLPVGGSYVRLGDYKLYRFYGLNDDCSDAYELYNVKEDISEKSNIIDNNKDKAEEMKLMLDEWLLATGALIPHPNPNYKP